jgi:ribosomal protein S17E
MNIAELLKKNVVMVPVVASLIVGTFTGVKYIVSLTETINQNRDQITIINDKHLKNQIGYIARIQENQSAESTWQMAENLYRQLADEVREHSYDIKDLNR